MDSSCSGQPIHLWQFLKELLLKPHSYGRFIRWLNKEKGEPGPGRGPGGRGRARAWALLASWRQTQGKAGDWAERGRMAHTVALNSRHWAIRAWHGGLCAFASEAVSWPRPVLFRTPAPHGAWDILRLGLRHSLCLQHIVSFTGEIAGVQRETPCEPHRPY